MICLIELTLSNCFYPKDMTKDRIEHCNKMGYSSGSPTLLAVISWAAETTSAVFLLWRSSMSFDMPFHGQTKLFYMHIWFTRTEVIVIVTFYHFSHHKRASLWPCGRDYFPCNLGLYINTFWNASNLRSNLIVFKCINHV